MQDRVEIVIPRRGISDDESFTKQPFETTREMVNFRVIDPTTRRSRGGQRSGTTKYNEARVSGANPVERMGQVVYDNPLIDFSDVTATPSVTLQVTYGSVAGGTPASAAGDTIIVGSVTYTLAPVPTVLNEIIGGVGVPEILTLAALFYAIQGTAFPGFTSPAQANSRHPLFHAPEVPFSTDGGDKFQLRLLSRGRPEDSNGQTMDHTGDIATNWDGWATDATFLPTGNGDQTEGGVNGAPLATEWSVITPDQVDAVACETDSEGNVYVLGASGVLVKYNSKGERLFGFALPMTSNQSTVRRVLIDADDAVYVGVSQNQGAEASRIWKLRPEDDDRMDLIWEINDLVGTLVDMQLRNGMLVVLENYEEELRATIAPYGFLNSLAPVRRWERAVPFPVTKAAIGTHNAVYTVSEPNADRGATPESADYLTRLIGWTPHELTRYEQRAYFHIDAQNMGVHAHKDRLDGGVPTSKFLDTQENGGQFPNIIDRAGRPLVPGRDINLPGGLSRQRRFGTPSYWVHGAGSLATIRFDADATLSPASSHSDFSLVRGSLLRTGRNTGTAPKEDQELDGLPNQRAMIPGYAGCKWACHLVLRIPLSSQPSIIFSQQGDDVSYSLIANAKHDVFATAPDGDPGWLSLRITDKDGEAGPGGKTSNAVHLADAALSSIVAGDADKISAGRFDVDADEEGVTHRTVLVTIVHGGKGNLNGSYWAVNGRTISTFTMNADACVGSNSHTLFGNRGHTPNGTTGLNTGQFGPGSVWGNSTWLHAFDGDLLEAITYLGDTTSEPHDTVVTLHGGVLLPVIPTASNRYSGPFDILPTDGTNSEVEPVEGYLVHKHGIQNQLEGEGTGANVGILDFFPKHPYGEAGGNANAPNPLGVGGGVASPASLAALKSVDPVLAKWGPNFGELIWAREGGGIGYGVALDEFDDVYTVGPRTAADGDIHARKTVDQGLLFTDTGGWNIQNTDPDTDQTYKYANLIVDDGNNLWWPIANVLGSNHLRRIKGITDAADAGGTTLWEHAFETALDVLDIAFPPTHPDYPEQGEDAVDTVTGPEFVYAVTNSFAQDLETLYKLRTVAAARSQGRHRKIVYWAIARGDLKVFTAGDPFGVPKGGLAFFDTNSNLIAAAVNDERVFLTDGVNLGVFHPRPNPDNAGGSDPARANDFGLVEEYVAKTAGEIPPRVKLLVSWNDRIVVARGDHGRKWAMSARGDPFDWDFDPDVTTVIQAVSADTSPTGLAPDIINAMVPYSDDLLLFLCDHSIWRLTGDPMMNGQFDKVSDTIGGAFGYPAVLSQEGDLFWFGSRGGIFRLRSGGGPPQRISEYRIERRTEAVDLDAFRVEMVWNYEDESLEVFFIPYSKTGTAVTHFSWDRHNDAWTETEFFAADHNPASVFVIDGDLPQDRKLLLGGHDGFIRFWDRSAADDDAQRIDSRVLCGPFLPGKQKREARFRGLEVVLAGDLDGCRWELFGSDEAANLGDYVASGDLDRGRNDRVYDAAIKASQAYVRFRNASPNERWAFEEAQIGVAPAGKRHRRGHLA